MERVLRPVPELEIPASVVTWRFDTSGGPGGQHANRANTRVEATLDLSELDLPEDLSARLTDVFGTRVKIVVDETRSQARNRELALDRLEERLATALRTPTRRRKTRPSASAKRRRVESKRRRGDVKRSRRTPTVDD